MYIFQARSNQAPVTWTGSLKVTVIPLPGVTPMAPFAGTVEATAGASSAIVQLVTGDALLRGAGTPETKSTPLSSVSVQPPAEREIDVLLLSAGAGCPSKKFAFP